MNTQYSFLSPLALCKDYQSLLILKIHLHSIHRNNNFQVEKGFYFLYYFFFTIFFILCLKSIDCAYGMGLRKPCIVSYKIINLYNRKLLISVPMTLVKKLNMINKCILFFKSMKNIYFNVKFIFLTCLTNIPGTLVGITLYNIYVLKKFQNFCAGTSPHSAQRASVPVLSHQLNL
jgi:hypothetical protein